MINMLGVFSEIYGEGAEMTMARALLIAVVGFTVVFVILGVIALFVKLMGFIFDSANRKKAAQQAELPPADPVYENIETPLPDDTSQGELVLVDVSEEEAALIMAITANKTGLPLNRLRFNSIKLIKEQK